MDTNISLINPSYTFRVEKGREVKQQLIDGCIEAGNTSE